MVQIPSLAALRAFEAAARHENFRLAAEELFVTHGAVAQQIRGLEADLKTALFKRLSRGVQLTEAGETYAKEIRSALRILRDATGAIAADSGKTSITLSVTPSFASCWLLPRLGRFSDGSGIELQVSASEDMADLLSGDADLAVRQSPPPFGKGADHKLLLTGANVIVGQPDLMQTMATVDDLAQANLLHDGHGGWPKYFARHLGEIPTFVEKGLRFNQAAMCIRLACDGDGLALVPEVLVRREIENGALKVFAGPAPDPGSGFYLVWPIKHSRRRDVSRVCDWLLREADA